MKVPDSRHLKRERLRSGVKHVLEGGITLPKAKLELPPFFQKEHHLCKLLASRYGESTYTIVEGFPDGDAPEDVVESHVDALSFHDEEYAKKLLATDDLIVRALRGSCTVVRRYFQWLDAVDIFTLGGRSFTVADVRREKVAEVGEDEARREGASSLAEWRRSWIDNLPASAGTPEWNGSVLCVRHEFVASDLVPHRPS
jgi:hypothetical protein